MKQLNITKILITLLFNTAGVTASAHDIEVKNEDDVTIYYSWTNDNTELAVSFRGNGVYDYSDEYSGNLTIPETVTYNGVDYYVTSIGTGVFTECRDLISVTIPNSVKTIGYGAFWYCSGLISVKISNNVNTIGEIAFADCSKLTSITLPNSLTSLGEGAFYQCTSLTSVIISNALTSINNNTFYGCNSLASITIPNSVTSIGNSAFFGCI